MPRPRLVLIAGATGYVGGRLLKSLESAGHRVRCLARRPEFLRARAAESTEVVQGDVLDLSSLASAMEGVDAAYYLVHSMGSSSAFEEEDRRAAENFARAAREAGVSRMVYLGGLGSGPDLSPHLASRQEVGRILRESGVPTIEFRASIIIGSGSLSFEMIRALVDRLPAMITPRWVRMRAQPISIEDVISYLVAALDVEPDGSTVFEIGGSERVSCTGTSCTQFIHSSSRERSGASLTQQAFRRDIPLTAEDADKTEGGWVVDIAGVLLRPRASLTLLQVSVTKQAPLADGGLTRSQD